MQPHEVAVPIVMFVSAVAAIIIWLMSRHRERMAMIEKGLSSEEIKAMYTKQIRRDPLTSLKWGLLFILGGLAVLFGNFLHQRFGAEDGIMIGLIPLFVGCGLLIFYGIASKKINQ